MTNSNSETHDEDPTDLLVEKLDRILPSSNFTQVAWKASIINEVLSHKGEGLTEQELILGALTSTASYFVEKALDMSRLTAFTRMHAEEINKYIEEVKARASSETPKEFKARWSKETP